MKLNLLIGVGHTFVPPAKIGPRRGEGPTRGTVVKPPWGPPQPDFEPVEGRPHINLAPRRKGSKHSGDLRPKLDANRSISNDYVHSYLVNSSADQYVPKTIEDTSNPDVSGFTTRVCRTPPRKTGVGEETLAGALEELRCGKL